MRRLPASHSFSLREQLLDAGIARLGAVLRPVPTPTIFIAATNLRGVNRLMRSLIYVLNLKPVEEPGRWYKPTLTLREIVGSFAIRGIPIMPFAQGHGFTTALGICIGGFAYSTDVTELDEQAFAALEGVELWVVDRLRREPHPAHSHLAKTLSRIARVRPRRAVLTHMDQSLDYREFSAELPGGGGPGRRARDRKLLGQ